MLNYPILTFNNGVQIPQFGLGVFLSEPGSTTAYAVVSALEAGYRHIDTAAMYHNEKDVAQGIRDSGVKREEIFITSKLSTRDIQDKAGEEGVKRSLDALDTDYLDLFLLHWPVPNYIDAWEVLMKYYEQKIFRAIGVSNFQPRHLEALESRGMTTPAVNQIELHPGFQQKTVKPYCEERGILIEAWSPLGGEKHLFLQDETIRAIAQKHGRTPAQIILRWHLQVGNIVFPKSTHRERIIENADIFDFTLDTEDLARIAAMDTDERSYWSPDRWNT